MNWLVPRILAGVLATLAGGLVGVLLGRSLNAPILGALAGGACAVAMFAVFDTVRGYRLIEWLRGSQEGQAPRDAGFWGELGYRVERSLRSRELALAQEQTRLTQFLSAIERRVVARRG
jgi:two-component system phosphate regulon sensor histidine kinase PhoR